MRNKKIVCIVCISLSLCIIILGVLYEFDKISNTNDISEIEKSRILVTEDN